MIIIVSFQSLQAVFFNKGENCIAAGDSSYFSIIMHFTLPCVGRLFVERSIYEQFIFRVVCVLVFTVLFNLVLG